MQAIVLLGVWDWDMRFQGSMQIQMIISKHLGDSATIGSWLEVMTWAECRMGDR